MVHRFARASDLLHIAWIRSLTGRTALGYGEVQETNQVTPAPGDPGIIGRGPRRASPVPGHTYPNNQSRVPRTRDSDACPRLLEVPSLMAPVLSEPVRRRRQARARRRKALDVALVLDDREHQEIAAL